MQRSNCVSRVIPSRGWDRVFLVLALGRDKPLWRIAGLPQELSRAPAAALSAGREFLVQVRGENDADRHAAAAARALTRLEDAYGPDVAAGVESFARRHFVRPKPFDVIDAWAGFLPTFDPS